MRGLKIVSVATNLLGPQGDKNTAQDIFQSPSPQGPFIRGDVDLNTVINLTDGIMILNWLSVGGPAPGCYDAADTNDTGVIDVSDAQRIFNYLFLGGDPPLCPFSGSSHDSCFGKDPTADGLPCGQTLPDCTPFSENGTCQ